MLALRLRLMFGLWPLAFASASVNADASSNTTFNFWYGSSQQFGQNGKPQVWIDLLGNVNDDDGISSLAYSLNGSSYRTLSIGPDGRRLQNKNEYNIQLAVTEVKTGTNTIVIKATDKLKNTTKRTVYFTYTNKSTPSVKMSVTWSNVNKVTDVMQPVDGKWAVSSSVLSNTTVGYDRMLAIGDMRWTDYEITVPIKVTSWDPAGFGGINGKPGAGFILRWNGHTNDPPVAKQPLSGWNPFGNCVWYSWSDNGGLSDTFENGNLNSSSEKPLHLDVTYNYKARVQTIPGKGTRYSKKVWQQGKTEPSSWMVQAYGTNSVGHGSIAFIAHYTNMTIGNIRIQPIASAGGWQWTLYR